MLWLTVRNNFNFLVILIEIIPVCSNSESKTKCLILMSKHNNSV